MPFRYGAQRSTFTLLLLLSTAIMLIGKADPTLYERTRMAVTDLTVPVLGFMSQPVVAASQLMGDIRNAATVYQDNVALREENERLHRWRAVAQGLESENARLRQMLNFAPEAPATYISGRVIGDSGGAFLRSVLLNIGAREGVRKGAAAVDDRGLIGRIAEVGEWSSRVLLVTDLNSRIPVFVGENRQRAIMAGDNTDMPYLAHLPAEISIVAGDLVITSGHGGAFPAGLPVGIVVRGDGELRVQPFLSAGRLEFVRLMDFGLTGVIQDQTLGVAESRTGR